MSLGYALLHPNRIQIALEADDRKHSFDDLTDFAFATMGAGDLGSAATEFARSRTEQMSNWFEASKSQWLSAEGPFGFLEPLLEQFSSFENIPDLLEDLFNLLESLTGPTLREKLHQWVDRFCNALPDLNGAALQSLLQEQVQAITGILEQPLRSGRRDVAAHRAFRAAVTMRQFIGDALSEAPWANSQCDLKMPLCLMLHQIITDVSDEILSAVAGAAETFRETFGGLFKTGFSFGGSASGSTGSDGPQPMANGSPSFRDEVKAVPHNQPGGLWAIDLVTNLFATFSLIWESLRTGNYRGRGLDGTLSVITILWQVTHTIMRAIPDTPINRAIDEPNWRKRLVNWLFTDQGNFSLNILIRFSQSFHEKGKSNWSLSLARRILSYYTYVTQVRSIYYYSRSLWYFQDRAQHRVSDEPEQVPFGRLLWGHWSPWLWFSACLSFFTTWEGFSLEKVFSKKGLDEPNLFLLILGIFGGGGLGFLSLGLMSKENPFGFSILPDWPTMILLYVLFGLTLVVLAMVLADLDSEAKDPAAIGVSIAAVLIVIPAVGLAAVFGSDGWAEASFVVLLTTVIGLIVASVIPFFLWWYYIDDGRDKHNFFEGKDAETSPYLLPYPAGENWLCGQGIHGIFSHYPINLRQSSETDCHFAFDFNESENKHALVSRDCIVLDIERNKTNGGDSANYINVQHINWRPGHDPGTDQERVLTYANYCHLSQHRVWTMPGHRLLQGYHLADIDNTGYSAQHHLHFDVSEVQRNDPSYKQNKSRKVRDVSVPIVFKDSSTHRFRNFPLLSWIPGKRHIPGKPLSMAFYTSDNVEQPPLINPIAIKLSSSGTPAHQHDLFIDRRVLPHGPLPDSLTLRTSVEKRHFHEITLDRSQIEHIAGLSPLEGLAVSFVMGHDHDLKDYDFKATASAKEPNFKLVNPPRGRLWATATAPYQLVGDQLVVRVNERATEYFFYGAIRPRLTAELTLDRGLDTTEALSIDGKLYHLAAPHRDLTVQGTVTALNQLFASASPKLPVAVRPEPVIVIETHRQGAAAALQVEAWEDSAFEAVPAATGSGALKALAGLPPADLAAHFDTLLRMGWPAAAAPVHSRVVAGRRLEITVGGSAIVVPTSPSTRNGEVLTKLYDTASRHLRSTGRIPCGRGRIPLGDDISVPILATCAQVCIDTSHNAFSPANLTPKHPLQIEVRGHRYELPVAAGAATPESLAAEIALTVEGVQTWVSGPQEVAVQTIAAGTAMELIVDKPAESGDALHLQARGDALLLHVAAAGCTFNGRIEDTAALEPEQLCALIADAVARGTVPYDVVTVAPQARMEGNTLVLEVASGGIFLGAETFSGGHRPFAFTQNGPNQLRSRDLSDSVDISGPGWVELVVGGHRTVVPFDGEPARYF
jgi:hypothetical protein